MPWGVVVGALVLLDVAGVGRLHLGALSLTRGASEMPLDVFLIPKVMQACFICSLELAFGCLGFKMVAFLVSALLVGAAEPPPSFLGFQMIMLCFQEPY